MKYLTNKKTKQKFPVHETGKIIAKELTEKDYNHLYKETAKRKNCLAPEGGFTKYVKEPDGNIRFERVEAVCGGASTATEKFLQNKYGKDVGKQEHGFYVGHGKEHSEDSPVQKGLTPATSFQKEGAVDHSWVRLADGSIIDGARGQFIEGNLKRKIWPQERFKIIPPMSPEQGAYKQDKAVALAYKYANPEGMKRIGL